MFRNISHSCPLRLEEMLSYRENRIISLSLLKHPEISILLFAMDKDEQISEETETGIQWVTVLEGELEILVSKEKYHLQSGQTIMIPSLVPHALEAVSPCKTMQIHIEEDVNMSQETYIKKLPMAEIMKLSEQIEYEGNKVSSLSVVQRNNLSITLFALDKGEEIGGHSSPGDAMVTVLEGTAEITIGDDVFTVEAGQSIIMPANIRHQLVAAEKFKFLLVVVKP